MHFNNEARAMLKILGIDDAEVEVKSERSKYPNGGFYSRLNKILVYGTNTSLARWGLFEILLHEATHKSLYDEGYEHWDIHDDVFWKRYAELRKKYEKMIDEV